LEGHLEGSKRNKRAGKTAFTSMQYHGRKSKSRNVNYVNYCYLYDIVVKHASFTAELPCDKLSKLCHTNTLVIVTSFSLLA
jgi:hypothetical protein